MCIRDRRSAAKAGPVGREPPKKRRNPEPAPRRTGCRPGPRPQAANRPAYYKYYVYVEPEALAPGWDRARIMAEFQTAGIPGLSGTCSEIFLEKAFADAGPGPAERLPVARELGETSLMLPVHPTLTEEEVYYMGRTAREILERASA